MSRGSVEIAVSWSSSDEAKPMWRRLSRGVQHRVVWGQMVSVRTRSAHSRTDTIGCSASRQLDGEAEPQGSVDHICT
jgi:hypothetical protein